MTASPAATPHMFCSATPIWKKRSGNFCAKKCVIVDSERSPTSTHTLGFSSPSSTSARPKPSRVFFMATGSARVMFMTGASRSSLHPRFPGVVGGAELDQGALALVLLGRLAVPVVVVLHEGDVLAHDRAREHHGGLALHRARLVIGANQRRNVMSVHLDGVPSKGAILLGQRR